mgnify:FL=1
MGNFMYRILEESGLGLIADLSCHLSNKKCHFCNHLILILPIFAISKEKDSKDLVPTELWFFLAYYL